jgi:anti-sigma28 factor (negative regulator of flagellin synthesis)
MKIDNPLLAQVTTGALQQTGGVPEPGSGSGGRNKVGQSDHVQLSNLGTALRDLAVEDPQHASSVHAIAAAVEAGQYQVDPVALGKKIVQEFTSLS